MEFKDSGIPWIGQIPKHWEVKKVKDGFYLKKDKALIENPVVLTLARSGIKVRDLENNEGQFAKSYFEYNPVDIDDILLNTMDLQSGANCNISKIKGVISPAYANLRYKNGFSPNFYNYYFKIQYWTFAFFAHGKGVSYENRWTLNNQTLMRFPLLVPPLNEQKEIAEFLDKKCEIIDKRLSNLERKIKSLKEYKKSLISECVTKGLNPKNMEFKDSGIPWIGQIPKHWEVTKIKYCLKENFGGCWGDDLENEQISQNSRLCIRVADFDFDKQKVKQTADTFRNYTKSQILSTKLQDGDLIIEKSGGGDKMPVGRSVVFEQNLFGEKEVLFANFCQCFRPLNINNKFFAHAMKAFYQNNNMRFFFNQTTGIQNLSIFNILNAFLPYPPLNEQKEIAEFLDKKCEKIDRLNENYTKQITALKEYKKSLIYECVTGKKEI